MDASTVLGTGLIVWGSKELLVRFLGPSADYLGERTVELLKQCDVNLNRIFTKALHKLGKQIDTPGAVNPRILKGILDEGSFCDDELIADYYGGILAASRDTEGKDDRGVMYLSLLHSLSSYQLRLHYLIYHCLSKLFQGSPMNMGLDADCRKMQLYISTLSFIEALELISPGESPNPLSLRYHALIGLHSKGLIGDNYVYGGQEHLQQYFHQATEDGGLLVYPSLLGAELYLWGQGLRNVSAHDLTKIEPPSPIIQIPDGICATKGVAQQV